MSPSELRSELARAGIGLFVPAARRPAPSPAELVRLVTALLTSRDPRLVASVPCLLALHDRSAVEVAESAARTLDESHVARLGLLYRLARALAVSRGPALAHLLGRPREIAASRIEPTELPSPEAELGERCLAVARELHEDDPEGNLVGDVEDLFDTWLRLAAAERSERAPA